MCHWHGPWSRVGFVLRYGSDESGSGTLCKDGMFRATEKLVSYLRVHECWLPASCRTYSGAVMQDIRGGRETISSSPEIVRWRPRHTSSLELVFYHVLRWTEAWDIASPSVRFVGRCTGSLAPSGE